MYCIEKLSCISLAIINVYVMLLQEMKRLQQAEGHIRPYKCPNEACGRTFKSATDMKKHNFQNHLMVCMKTY